MTLRVARWTALAVGAVLVVLAIVAGAGSRTATLRALVIDTLAERLDSDVELESFSVDTFPVVRINGTGLVIRHKGRRDVPPLVTIKRFAIEGGLFGLMSRPRRFRSVRLDGLQVTIPPGGFSAVRDANRAPRDSAAPPAQEAPASDAGNDRAPTRAAIVIDRLVSDDAALALIPKKAGKLPRVFAIHRLTLEGLGRGEPMPFEAAITNPLPKGIVLTRGTFGPWRKGDPGQSPLSGAFTFNDVDLSTVKGIGGGLDASGTFGGMLARIDVEGRTESPDFRVNVAANPVPLATTFKAVVDGTDGDTYLNHVAASFLKTSLTATGAVVGQEGVKGRTVKVHVKIDEGRIEDVLKLAMKGERPVLTGQLALHADLLLPPGPADVMERLALDGEFTIASARFTDRAVQLKLAEMSQRATPGDADVDARSVLSNFAGRFRLADARLNLPDARFAIPGAGVQVAGRYGLRDESLEFDGTLRMQATISQAAGGGMKSVLLKAVDPIFRKDGAGAVVPIRIRGTRTDPKIGVDLGRVIGR
jgi:hypothetical protein